MKKLLKYTAFIFVLAISSKSDAKITTITKRATQLIAAYHGCMFTISATTELFVNREVPFLECPLYTFINQKKEINPDKALFVSTATTSTASIVASWRIAGKLHDFIVSKFSNKPAAKVDPVKPKKRVRFSNIPSLQDLKKRTSTK